jgi:hypothetical protein
MSHRTKLTLQFGTIATIVLGTILNAPYSETFERLETEARGGEAWAVDGCGAGCPVGVAEAVI